MVQRKKDKIINDPIYGFVHLEEGIILQLIEHPFFQRLRRISQLGLSYLVYPGAHHTRFHHAIGSLYLMQKAIEQLRKKGQIITEKESEGACIAILLHDIGHGPFSHALEKAIVKDLSHEKLSLLFMEELNRQFKGKLTVAIQIFKNEYPKMFLHQLVSSQLDMDRLDYLKRDSFYSGVQEGIIGTERIINMLNVVNDHLVIEEKGIYSIEKFLIARRLMYWQVYLHKTVLSAENTLIKVLERAKELIAKKNQIFTTPTLLFFLKNNFSLKDFISDVTLLEHFSMLDDHDFYTALKQWTQDKDPIISSLSKMIIHRNLLKISIQEKPFSKQEILAKQKEVKEHFNLPKEYLKYFVFSDKVSNSAYKNEKCKIKIWMKDNSIKDIIEASDQLTNDMFKEINKYFLCYPNTNKLFDEESFCTY